MNFDPTLLLLSLIPSGIGFVLFVYGKKQQQLTHIAAGIAFMVYPYFVATAMQMILGGALVTGALWYARRAGW